MATPSIESNQPIMLQTAEAFRAESEPVFRPRQVQGRSGIWAMAFACALATFWVGSSVAYLWGYYGLAGLSALPLQQLVLIACAGLLPAVLIVSAAWAMTRGADMSRAAETLAEATEKLFSADETSSRMAARLGRAVRRELDGLNAGLDGAFARLRALESVLEEQIAAVDDAGARVGVHGEAVAARLTQERERIEGVAASLAEAAARASEAVAGRAAQLKATMESAEGALRTAAQSLDTQAANFRQAAAVVAEAPRNAAVELDTQAKRIESVADAAMARAEFVLGRQERHRTAMTELLQRLKEEGTGFEGTLAAQRVGIERAIGALQTESQKFEQFTGDTDRQINAVLSGASERNNQLTQSLTREVERMREVAEASSAALARMVETLREAGTGANELIGEITGKAKNEAKGLVGEAMAECERLLRTASSLTVESGAVRETLSRAVDDVERHIVDLPALAQQEAQRVRQMVRTETEEMLDISARTLSTIHARSVPRALQRPAHDAAAQDESEGDGLLGLARRLTQRPKRKTSEGVDIRQRESKPWEMSALLAAAGTENGQGRERDSRSDSAGDLDALQAALADMAIDLESIAIDCAPSETAWRRYLAGERGAFAHKVAEAIDDRAVDRIAALYRDDARFREAANSYLAEFETLLARAREGDPALASSVLNDDTGKIYLAVAYALGRL